MAFVILIYWRAKRSTNDPQGSTLTDIVITATQHFSPQQKKREIFMKISEARVVKIVKHLRLLIPFLAGNMCATSWKSNQRIIIWSTASLNFRIFFCLVYCETMTKLFLFTTENFHVFEFFRACRWPQCLSRFRMPMNTLS